MANLRALRAPARFSGIPTQPETRKSLAPLSNVDSAIRVRNRFLTGIRKFGNVEAWEDHDEPRMAG